MKTIRILFFIVFLFETSLSLDFKTEKNVYILTESNFDSFLRLNNYVMVNFCDSTDKFCEKFDQQYKIVASTVKIDETPIEIARIDCSTEKYLADRFNIKKYPSLIFFTNGQPQNYNGDTNSKEILKWFDKKLGPSSKEFVDQNGLQRFIEENEVVAVYFGNANSRKFQKFIEFTKTTDDYWFAHSFIPEIREYFDIEVNTLVVFKKFEEKRNVYDGLFEESELKPFLLYNSLPRIIKFDLKTAYRLISTNVPIMFLFFDSNSNNVIKSFEEASFQLKGRILMSIANINDDISKKLADYLSVSELELPSIRILHSSADQQKIYALNENITKETILNFYDEFIDKQLKPLRKSGKVPLKNDGPVKIVVRKNFEEIVTNSTKNVVLLFDISESWCIECENFRNIYEKIASKRNDDSLLFGKVDIIANEIDKVHFKNLPAIKFFPLSNKSAIIDYNDELKEDLILDFINRSSDKDISSLKTERIEIKTEL